jgi:hypothetical protein
MKKLGKVITHRTTRFHQQWEFGADIKATAGIAATKKVVVTMDFSAVPLYPNVCDQDTSHAIPDLIFVIEWHHIDQSKQRLYVDILCDDPLINKNDFYYVRAAWLYLLERTQVLRGFTEISIWSDNAAKHFHQRYTLRFFHELQQQYGIKIRYNFKAAHHGHCLADAHSAHVNRQVRQKLQSWEKEAQQQKTQVTKTMTTAIITDLLEAKLHKTVVYNMETVDRTPQLKPAVKPVPKIKSYHCFTYEDDGMVMLCRPLTRPVLPDKSYRHTWRYQTEKNKPTKQAVDEDQEEEEEQESDESSD